MRQGPLQVCELLVVGPHELLLALLHVCLVQLPQTVQLLTQQRLVLSLHHNDDDALRTAQDRVLVQLADLSTRISSPIWSKLNIDVDLGWGSILEIPMEKRCH